MPDTLLPAIEHETGPNPTASVIWLHGLGADGSDFVPVVPELRLPASLPVRFVFPHAPVRPVTINAGYAMRAWYDIRPAPDRSLDFERHADEGGIRESQAAVDGLIEREKSRGVAASRIVLAGFSQGGAIALFTGLRHPERLAGIVALSTYLPLAPVVANEAHAANRGVPIFMAHGTHDDVIPLRYAVASKQALEANGYPVEWHQYPMPHSVCLEEIQAISRWLQKAIV